MRYVKSKLEQLPYFNIQTASVLLGKKGLNLYRQIERLVRNGYLLRLKSGLYVTKTFVDRNLNNPSYNQQIANTLRFPSYLSLEYVLAQNGLIPEAINNYTSITLKSPRSYKNFLGTFAYTNIKESLYLGYSNGIASKAKALFDYLYLKKNLPVDYTQELSEGLRINWNNFSKKDLKDFRQFCFLAKSLKMNQIYKIMTTLV